MPTKDTNKLREKNKRYDAKRAGKRARAWTAMVYEDSAVPEWQDKLRELLVECLISPLHDKDVWTEADEAANPAHKAGTHKKSHWHIVLAFKNPVTYSRAVEVFKTIGAAVPPENTSHVRDFKQMARYLCHLDQPTKHRYDIKEVTVIGAIDYNTLVMSGADENDIIDAMCQYIDDHKILSYRQFCIMVRQQHPEWRQLVYHDCAAMLSRYIRSFAWELEQEKIAACLSPQLKDR